MKQSLKKVLLKIDKERMMRNAIILVFVLSIFVAIDQFTKVYAFAQSDAKWIGLKVGPTISKGKLFGMRLVINTGMFSSLGAGSVPYWGVQTITSLILIVVVLCALFGKNKIVVFGLSLIAAGAFGNILDRYMLISPSGGHYVRDWIYNPFYDKGTYNIADMEVIFGSPIAAIGIFIGTMKETKNDDKKKTKTGIKNRMNSIKFKVFKRSENNNKTK